MGTPPFVERISKERNCSSELVRATVTDGLAALRWEYEAERARLADRCLRDGSTHTVAETCGLSPRHLGVSQVEGCGSAVTPFTPLRTAAKDGHEESVT